MRRGWNVLPEDVTTAIAERLGDVLDVVPACHGDHAEVAAAVVGRGGRVFVKAASRDMGVRSLRYEVAATRAVGGCAPTVLWDFESAGWLVVGTEYLEGPHPVLSPGSPDLELLAVGLTALQETPAPEGTWYDPAARCGFELPAMAGRMLVHSDLNPTNLIVTAGGLRIMDWAYTTRAASWVELALLVPWLIGGGHTPRCRDVTDEQHSSAWAMRRDASLDYWKRVTDAAPPPAAAAPTTSTARWATLRSMPVTTGVDRLAARLSISAQSVLYAAYCRILADSLQQGRFLIGLLASNRVTARWRNLVSSMNQLVPVLVRTRPDEDFASFTSRLYAESIVAYRYGCYDVDALAPIEARTGYNGAGRGFQSFFNFIPPAEAVSSTVVGSEDPDAWTITTRDHGRDNGFPFYLVIDGGRPVVCTLRVGSAPDYEPLRDFLLRLQQIIVTAATPE
ncbi:hypothetical protein [Micromonospora yangpuensis]|uniref:Phosphotransferase enzyme family protein n=1 Tax=Micromonospora yangpuensis TaxID=683228 RepID=A0A1C6UWD4_9ACTN|nr:hypothetical protein [Micromonospora yangpuensis]GGM25370.1 hypothetical protein GCM10012279_49760 [Micromonospora yangpuensis]SCL58355.1 hypothetical protein GA0070617_3793 [Micromonospora yangpuensis]